MSLSPEELRFIAEYTASVIGKMNQVLDDRITTTLTNSNDVIPSSKLVKDEFATVRSEIPTNTSDLTNDGADGTHAFIIEGDSRLDDTRSPKPHNQASSTITDTNTYQYINNSLQNQASINAAINEKIGALMNLDIIEQVSTRPTASAETMNKIYLVPEETGETEDLFKIFITVYENNAYKWEKIDTARIDISGKQDKIDNSLSTTAKTIVGAINEIFSNTNNKQDKTDNSLNTSDKTVVGAINSLNSGKQDKTDNSLQTSDKTIVGAINLLKNNVDTKVDSATFGSELSNYIRKLPTEGLIKNDGTLDTNHYLTSADMPESFNYGYLDSNLVLHLICVDGEVTATNSVIQSGDPNTITAVITDKDNNPLEGMPVEFLFNGVKQGQTVNSNANGIATYSYTGTGVGEVDVQVRVGNFLSEIYDVLDCQFLDVATTGKKNEDYYSNTRNVSIQVTDTGAVFSSNNSNTANLLPNIGNTPSSIADVRDFEAPFCVEIDIVEFTGTTHQLGFNSADDGDIGRNFSQLNITAPTHLTIKIGEEINGIKYCNYYVGDTTTPTWSKQINGTSPFAVVLQSIATYYWKFRNFKIYPI